MKSCLKVLVGLVAFGLLPLVAQAVPLTFAVNLTGPGESPSNTSPGTGFALVTIDSSTHLMQLDVVFSGLLGTTTASHIHSPTPATGTGTAGVATTTPTFLGFPLGVTSGSYQNTLDMTLASSYNPSFVSANGGTTASAEAALFSGISSGKAYLNIHTSVFPSGELRGFLISVVPLPPAFWTGGVTLLAGMLLTIRKRKA